MSALSASHKFLYFAGIDIRHSISPLVHNYVAKRLGKDWSCEYLECPIEEVAETFHKKTFVGGIITMPFKQSIMPFLDNIDDLAAKLGACNHVYLGKEGELHGTNTDFRGIAGALLDAKKAADVTKEQPLVGLVIGAGGASRAAIYALSAELGCQTVYIINRDDEEVADLAQATQHYCPHLIHIKTTAESEALATPFYIVGAVPDFTPVQEKEIEVRAILTGFLAREQKGILLDMCYKPRRTEHLRLGEKYGWKTLEGVQVVLNLVYEQWKLWTGESIEGMISKDDIKAYIDHLSSH